jgi:hypothetical protein
MKTLTQLQQIVSLHGAQLVKNYPLLKIYFPKIKGEKEGQTYEVHAKSEAQYHLFIDEAFTKVVSWAQEAQLKIVTKKMIKIFIQDKLRTDDRWAYHALEKLYERQTADEKASEATHWHNNAGFTGHDATFLTKLIRQKQQKGWLSKKQMAAIRKTIAKYWSQVEDMSDQVKLRQQVLAAQPKPDQLQMELK